MMNPAEDNNGGKRHSRKSLQMLIDNERHRKRDFPFSDDDDDFDSDIWPKVRRIIRKATDSNWIRLGF